MSDHPDQKDWNLKSRKSKLQDGWFICSECYITNQDENKCVDCSEPRAPLCIECCKHSWGSKNFNIDELMEISEEFMNDLCGLQKTEERGEK